MEGYGYLWSDKIELFLEKESRLGRDYEVTTVDLNIEMVCERVEDVDSSLARESERDGCNIFGQKINKNLDRILCGESIWMVILRLNAGTLSLYDGRHRLWIAREYFELHRLPFLVLNQRGVNPESILKSLKEMRPLSQVVA